MTRKEILKAIDDAGCITWWPGGASHNAIADLQKEGLIVLTDVSGSQETKYVVRRVYKGGAA